MLSGPSANMEDMVPRSRSGEGDTRATGDINSSPPPDPHLVDPPSVAIETLLRNGCDSFGLPSYAQYHRLLAALTARHTEAQKREAFLLKQQHLAATIHSPPVVTLETAPHQVDVALEIPGKRGVILQPHTDGVLALPIEGVPASPEPSSRVINVGGDILELPTPAVPESTDSSPRVTRVGGDSSAPSSLGIGIATSGGNDAATTAPDNQHKDPHMGIFEEAGGISLQPHMDGALVLHPDVLPPSQPPPLAPPSFSATMLHHTN